jgi:hypothetical protein
MEMRLRVNTLLLLNLNAFFLEKVLYYMKVIIIWDILQNLERNSEKDPEL